jgi:hypothetical protein
MRVLIEQPFFAGPDALSLRFLEIFALARDGRHTVLTRPLFGSGNDELIEAWLAALPKSVAEEVRLVLRQGVIDATKLLAGVAGITVTDSSSSDWISARLRLHDAVRLLRTPLGLLLENRRADLHFLLALAPPTHRRQLKSALEHGWIEVLHGGGLGDMEALIQELQSDVSTSIGRKARLLRLWVMFDRDSAPSDRSQPSPSSERMKTLCENSAPAAKLPWPLSYHQLGRRAIENYLPERLLRVWQEARSGDENTKRRRAVEALCELRKTRPTAAHQLHMKKGLYGDLVPEIQKDIKEKGRDIQDQELDPLFRGLPDWIRKALASGFGKDAAQLFVRDFSGFEEEFRVEFDRERKAHEPSRKAILDSLFARL